MLRMIWTMLLGLGGHLLDLSLMSAQVERERR